MAETSRVVRMHAHGGPEVLRWEEETIGSPGVGEVRLRQTAVGLNFIDVYHRGGLYPLPLPATPGLEGAGVVEAVGPGVTGFAPGDRVAYAGGPVGAYAERRLMPAEHLVKLPDGVDEKTAAAMMLKGMTVQVLIHQVYRVSPGETVLWHAAAGGVGSIACQWLKALGVTVIGTVGSEEKARQALAHGCAHVIDYRREDVAERVRELTGGKGVPVVYDSVGKATWTASLDCLQPRGLMVSFGNASGPVPPVDLLELARKGSLYLTRPLLFHYIASRETLLASAQALFEQVLAGRVRIDIGQTYPLAEAARAHRDLEARKTHGATVLLP